MTIPLISLSLEQIQFMASMFKEVRTSMRRTSSSDTWSFFLNSAILSKSFALDKVVCVCGSSGVSTRTDTSSRREIHNAFSLTSSSSCGSLSDAVFLMLSGRGSNVSMVCIAYCFVLPYSCFWKVVADTFCAVAFRLHGSHVQGVVSSSLLTSDPGHGALGIRDTRACNSADTCTQQADNLDNHECVWNERVEGRVCWWENNIETKRGRERGEWDTERGRTDTCMYPAAHSHDAWHTYPITWPCTVRFSRSNFTEQVPDRIDGITVLWTNVKLGWRVWTSSFFIRPDAQWTYPLFRARKADEPFVFPTPSAM